MKLGLVSLGCPKNLVDSEVMLGLIREKAFEITNDPSEADIIIVNTCGFIESAKEESINTILQMAEYKQEGACKHLIMTGCLGQRYADELFENIPEVDAIVGKNSFTEIAWVIDEVMKGRRFVYLDEAGYVPNQPRMLTTPSYMAYLKIADGCSNRCTYCAIPSIRGNYRSVEFETVIEEAKALASTGIKELILIAQDTTNYGFDLYGKIRLPELLDALCEIDGIEWIRILYCYPDKITDELLETMAKHSKVLNYIDLPLQHADDNILKAMNRRGDSAYLRDVIAKIRIVVICG